jgi:hypothetical protein
VVTKEKTAMQFLSAARFPIASKKAIAASGVSDQNFFGRFDAGCHTNGHSD